MIEALLIVGAYLIGSIPTGVIVGRMRGWAWDGYYLDVGTPEALEKARRDAPGLQGRPRDARGGKRPAVFLDRDGVIVVPHFRDGRSFAPRRLEDFRLYPEAAASLQRLKRAGFLLAVVTNQPDVGNGLIPHSEVDAMHEIMTRELPLDAVKACFHGQAEHCNCRKPKPGMVLDAAAKHAF